MPTRVVDGAGEGAIALVEQHADIGAAPVGHDQVVAVAAAVQVGDGDAPRLGADRVGDLGLESAVAVAEQDADGIGAVVGHGNIELAVAVQVADGDGDRVGADGIVDGALEGAVAVAQHHGDGAAVVVGGDQVERVSGAAQAGGGGEVGLAGRHRVGLRHEAYRPAGSWGSPAASPSQRLLSLRPASVKGATPTTVNVRV